MTTKLFLMCVTAASAAYSGVAMPTEAEVEKAVPKVERMLASEKVALESGKMTLNEEEENLSENILVSDTADRCRTAVYRGFSVISHNKDSVIGNLIRKLYVTLTEAFVAYIRLIKLTAVYENIAVFVYFDNITCRADNSFQKNLVVIVEGYYISCLKFACLKANHDLTAFKGRQHT